MKILAVDDDNIALEILCAALRNAGHSDFVTASCGFSALDQIHTAEQPIDMFLLDIQMPGMNGIDLCAKIRRFSRYRTAPILMITSMTERRYIEGAFEAGAVDYINKPFDPIELGVRINLADRMVLQQQQIQASQTELDYMRMHTEMSADAQYAGSLDCEEISQLTGITAMQNHLLRLKAHRASENPLRKKYS